MIYNKTDPLRSPFEHFYEKMIHFLTFNVRYAR